MSLAHLMIPNNEFLNKDPDAVPEQATIIILDKKSVICKDKNGKYTKQTRKISRIIHLLINGEDCNFQNKVWCEGGLQLADIGTKNIREEKLNPKLEYPMVILDNLHNTCTIGVIGYRRV